MSYIGQEPGQGQAERFLFTAAGTGTAVTADDDGVSVGYTVGQVSVYLNGVKQVIGTGKDVTATDGSTITFLASYASGDVIEVIALSTFSPADTVPATGGTFSGNVIMGANLTVSGTTTTIDTAVTVSDAMVINNAGSDIGLKVNSTSSGHIIQLQDGGVDQFVIADGGAVTVTGATTATGLITANGGLETDTNSKIKQKGAFMQSSTHQSWVMGG
jgi:hypothetical protein